MGDQVQDDSLWEEAYLRLSHDAIVGRFLSGLLHNLNGVVQTFSMQVDLQAMMFPRAEELLDQLDKRFATEIPEELVALRELLKSRAGLIEQAMEKARSGQNILRRITPLAAFQKSLLSDNVSVNNLVEEAIEFHCSNSFFKHKVEKELVLAPDLPILANGCLEVYQVLSAVLENAIEALDEASDIPRIRIETMLKGDNISLVVENSVASIPKIDNEQIFKPFVTTKENHAGLGLYFAEKLLESAGGSINCESRSDVTRFQIIIPSMRLKAEG